MPIVHQLSPNSLVVVQYELNFEPKATNSQWHLGQVNFPAKVDAG